MAAPDLVVPPPSPKILDYPGSIGLVDRSLLTTILLVVTSKFDATGGVLTVSLLVILAFLGRGDVLRLFHSSDRRNHVGRDRRPGRGVCSVVAFWLAGERSRQMSLIGLVLVVVLV